MCADGICCVFMDTVCAGANCHVAMSVLAGILEREQEQSVVYGSVDFGKTVVTSDKYKELVRHSFLPLLLLHLFSSLPLLDIPYSFSSFLCLLMLFHFSFFFLPPFSSFFPSFSLLFLFLLFRCFLLSVTCLLLFYATRPIWFSVIVTQALFLNLQER